MVEIIPSINAPTFAEVEARIRRVEPYVSWCHLDVTDGIFSTHRTWRDPADLAHFQTKLRVEVHLMVMIPERIVDPWLVKPVERIIVHWEAVEDFEAMIQKCRAQKIGIGFAIKPDTSWEVLKPWVGRVDLVQVLGVNPGPSGQIMGPESIEKVRRLREFSPKCAIEVDGGVNPKLARQAMAAGATYLVAGSYLFSQDVGEALEALRRASQAAPPLR